MASLPPVKLDTHEDWFNLLMTVLHQQAEQNPYEEYREMAQKLIDQFMRYGRPFVDSDHAPCVALRMYPKEAGNTIWLLLLYSGVITYIVLWSLVERTPALVSSSAR